MKYEVKMSCGHIETVELFGSNSDRERKLSYYETKGVCRECYANAVNNETNAFNTEMGLPELIGSEKQIKFANDLRKKQINIYIMEKKIYLQCKKDNKLNDLYKQVEDNATNPQMARLVKFIKIVKETDAKNIINMLN